MSFRTISAILKGAWLIDQSWAETHYPLVSGIIEGKVQIDAMKPAKGEMSSPFMVMPDGKNISFFEEKVSMFGVTQDTSKTNSKSVPGTVAVIPVIGPIIKYDGSCGEAGSLTRSEWFKMAEADENVVAIIGYIDSPGGQVDGTASFADTIKSLSKPTIAIIDDGMMASAAMWIGSAFDEIYATQPTDSAGSIGVYCTFLDVTGFYEKNGIKVHTVYAPQSTEKNIEVKEAFKGKYSLMEEDLSFIAQTFINVIKTNRGDRLTSDIWNKGGMYYANEAIEIGLIDGIKGFEELVSYARSKADLSEKNTSTSRKSTNSTNMKFPKLAAFAKLAASDITPEMVAEVNTELAEAEIEGVTLVLDTEHQTLAEQAEQAASLQETVNARDGQITTLTAELSAANEKLNKPAGSTASPVADNDVIQDTDPDPGYNMTSVDKEKARMQAEW